MNGHGMPCPYDFLPFVSCPILYPLLSRSRTRSLSTLPSTVFPSRRVLAALITAPICLGEFMRFGDGRFDRLLELRVAGSSGQIAFDDSNFLGFFISQVGAPAAAELLDRFSTLLDQGLEHLERLGILEWAALLDFLVLERSLDHAQTTRTQLG